MTDRSKNIKLFGPLNMYTIKFTSVGNLPYEVTESELRNVLQGCGNIRFLIIRKDKQTNKSKGYAHVEYRHEWEAVEAFKRLLGKELRGRILKVDFCEDVIRSRHPDLVAAAASVFQNGVAIAVSQSPSVFPDFVFETSTHVNQTPFLYPATQHIPFNNSSVEIAIHQDEFEQKRGRCDEEMLIDEKGRICNRELLRLVKEMNMFDIAKYVEEIDHMISKSPMNTRYVLQGNPKMQSALIHAKVLLGSTSLDLTRATKSVQEFDVALDYFNFS
ncbi:RNA recognition motif domain containing protein, putative [Babesia bigemina]|uniref:RNA recognition motif domain containing protein, putative n=1 Tax=Babesia bigemina TaxID=5866 RepID=A0A061D488_BABBI|nr:RNA recognition motif domain containing protein, putative [Babesia bigemina]CDR95388.1 RNA recognition motif domain containing protein, putative [Babesia bigemina]|eukprot:XP_012767574.1 RNA recognition motif domain containing protein, putative [Babesia bigemina]